MKCHICGENAEFWCRQCEESVCEECCIPYTIHNNIDYTLCVECNSANEMADYNERKAQRRKDDIKKAKQKARNDKARERYWLPDTIEKRNIRRAELVKKRQEHRIKMMEETIKIVNKMFNI